MDGCFLTENPAGSLINSHTAFQWLIQLLSAMSYKAFGMHLVYLKCICKYNIRVLHNLQHTNCYVCIYIYNVPEARCSNARSGCESMLAYLSNAQRCGQTVDQFVYWTRGH
jgi:hypothetical protein